MKQSPEASFNNKKLKVAIIFWQDCGRLSRIPVAPTCATGLPGCLTCVCAFATTHSRGHSLPGGEFVGSGGRIQFWPVTGWVWSCGATDGRYNNDSPKLSLNPENTNRWPEKQNKWTNNCYIIWSPIIFSVAYDIFNLSFCQKKKLSQPSAFVGETGLCTKYTGGPAVV